MIPPDNKLTSLSPRFYFRACELIAVLAQHRIPVVVIETRRPLPRQVDLYRAGASKTMKSRHLEGDAIDLAPIETYSKGKVRKIEWSGDAEVYAKMGAIARSLGLQWGGDFKNFRDLVHFEMGD